MKNKIINNIFSETWKEIDTDIDFSKYEPISKSTSLHVDEEKYEIDVKNIDCCMQLEKMDHHWLRYLYNIII